MHWEDVEFKHILSNGYQKFKISFLKSKFKNFFKFSKTVSIKLSILSLKLIRNQFHPLSYALIDLKRIS